MGRRCCGTSSICCSVVWLALALLLAALVPSTAAAQRLRVEGDVAHPAAEALRRIVAAEQYRVVSRDTLIPAESQIQGDLVIVGSDVRLAGAVQGSVVVLEGSLFLRPGSRVVGSVISARGAYLSSTRAEVGDTLSVPAEIGVEVVREGDVYTVRFVPPPPRPILEREGIFGFAVPSYDRVNGVTLGFGLRRVFVSDTLSASVGATATYHTARKSPGGRVELLAPLGERHYVAVRAARETQTVDAWIRGNLANSAAALFLRSDIRNYFESDYVALRAWRAAPQSLDEGTSFLAPHLELRASRDRSLRARNVWTVLQRDEPWRENPDVFEGTLTSLLPGFGAGWRGITAEFASDVTLEWAFPSPVGRSWGERQFLQLVGDGQWQMLALGSHTLAVRSHLMKTLSQHPPPQRWGLLGGTGTLPTLDDGALRGDNLVFVESTYGVPLQAITAPVIGSPTVVLRHAIGSAWLSGEEGGPWTQNLAAGLQFNLFNALVYVDPAEGFGSTTLSLSLELPF